MLNLPIPSTHFNETFKFCSFRLDKLHDDVVVVVVGGGGGGVVVEKEKFETKFVR